MREIFFRGKDRMGGEWVYGDLYQERHSDGTIKTTIVQPLSVYNVDPDTVGQYTGVVDTNGKQIYEGDIVGYTDRSTGKTSVLGVVRWSREGCFYINTDSIHNYNTENSGANLGHMMPSHRSLTIIGNIHDNPEMIK